MFFIAVERVNIEPKAHSRLQLLGRLKGFRDAIIGVYQGGGSIELQGSIAEESVIVVAPTELKKSEKSDTEEPQKNGPVPKSS